MRKQNTKIYVLLIISILLIIFFTYLEFINPYYFLRNDNLYQFYGPISNSFETILTGEFPFLNQYQNMGVPLFEMGYYAILYPILFVSFLISKFLVNKYLLFEIYTLIHLVLGFIFTYYLSKKISKNIVMSLVASLSFIFCGYAMIKLHDWYYMAPVLIFMPLILLIHEQIMLKGTLKQFVILGIIRGIFYYSGNIQFIIYTLFFELLYVIIKFISNNYSLKKISKYIFSSIFSIIIALPNIILIGIMSINSSRKFSIGGYFTSHAANPIKFLIGNLFPSKIISFFSNDPEYSYYYVNLFLFLGLLSYILYIIKQKKLIKNINSHMYVLLAIISIVLSFGFWGILYNFFVIVPIWKNFIHPVKFMIFSSLFISLSGAKFISKKIDKKIQLLILFLTILILFVQLPLYSNTLNFQRDDIPFKTANLSKGRILSIIETDRYETKYLSQNYASLQKSYHVSGYEPLQPNLNKYIFPINRFGRPFFPNTKINYSILSEYGIKWIISENKLSSNVLKLQDKKEDYYLYEVQNSVPIIFVLNNYEKINYIQSSNGIQFSTNFKSNEKIIFTNVFHDAYVGTINNQKTKLTMDEYGRISINVPKGKNNIKIEYKRDIFWYTIFLSIISLLIIMFFHKQIITYLYHISKIAIIFFKKYLKISLKYSLFLILILFILYSGTILLHLNNQGIISSLKECELNPLIIQCTTLNYQSYNYKKMCSYLQEKGIKFTLIGEVKNFC